MGIAICVLLKYRNVSVSKVKGRPNVCYVRISAQEGESPVKFYSAITSSGRSTRREAEHSEGYAKISWDEDVQVLYINRGNIEIYIKNEQLSLVKGCAMDIDFRSKPSNSSVALSRPLTDKWFRVSLGKRGSKLDRLTSWYYSEDSKKPRRFDVAASAQDWENIVFPRGASVSLTYEPVGIVLSRNLAENYTGMDVEISIVRTEKGDNP